MKIVIVGGGIVGAVTAWRLAQAGAEVTVVDRGAFGQGTTAASFGWLNTSAQLDRDYFALKMDALNGYRDIARQFNSARWLHLDGHLEWSTTANEGADARGTDGLPLAVAEGSPAERLQRKVAMLREWGMSAHLLPIADLPRLEPDLQAPAGVESFAWYPFEGYLDSIDAIGDLLHHAKHLGTELRPFTECAGLLREDGRIVGIGLADGSTLHADVVVLTAGPEVGQLAATADVDVPISPMSGVVATTSPVSARLRAVHHSDGVSIRPAGAGRLMIRHYDFDEFDRQDSGTDAHPEWLPDLLARAVEVMPSLTGAKIDAIERGVRPIPGDGMPVLGYAGDGASLYVAVSHGAVTLAPVMADIACREIMQQETDFRAEPFRPNRFRS